MKKVPTPHPFLPVATIDDVLSYNVSDASTHTPSPLVNAVAEALHNSQLLDAGDLAEYLQLDRRKLSAALQIELGITLKDLVMEYRLYQIKQYQASHPEATLDQVAIANGYSSDNSLFRLFLRRYGTKPNGEKSTGDREEWRDKMKQTIANIQA